MGLNPAAPTKSGEYRPIFPKHFSRDLPGRLLYFSDHKPSAMHDFAAQVSSGTHYENHIEIDFGWRATDIGGLRQRA